MKKEWTDRDGNKIRLVEEEERKASPFSGWVISGIKYISILLVWLIVWCGVMITMESYYLIEDNMPYAIAGFFLYPVLTFIERIFKK